MTNYGMKVGPNIHLPLLDINKGRFTLISTDETMKVYKKGVVSTDTTVTHDVSFTPTQLTYRILNSDTEAYVDKDSNVDSTSLYVNVPISGKVFYSIYINNF